MSSYILGKSSLVLATGILEMIFGFANYVRNAAYRCNWHLSIIDTLFTYNWE
jgi:hypothetical protein